jgi:ribosomal protein S18 acetylase RimI-like enzyme
MSTTSAPAPVDHRAVFGPLVTAFGSDPVIRWIYPDAHTYLTSFPPLVELIAAPAVHAGTIDCVAARRGTAVWLAPGEATDDDAIGTHLSQTVDPRRLDDVLAFLEAVTLHHPDRPLWYLPFIGIDPQWQGKALGTQLLRQGLSRADDDDQPAYLEASTVRNRGLYERHGFEVVGEVRAGDSPPLWPMLRTARGAE